MNSEAELRRDIAHLRVLAEASTDGAVHAELELLILELEERLRQSGTGIAMELAPDSVWWPEPTRP